MNCMVSNFVAKIVVGVLLILIAVVGLVYNLFFGRSLRFVNFCFRGFKSTIMFIITYLVVSWFNSNGDVPSGS